MTAEVCPADDIGTATRAAAASTTTTPSLALMVDSVAQVIAGISIIGHACNELRAAGWSAKIAANRITVDDVVEAQLIPSRFGASGLVEARWVVSPVAEAIPSEL